MGPTLWPSPAVLKASVPYQATALLVVGRSPENLKRSGVPLWNVVMPDICHPSRNPRVIILSNFPRASFGRLKLYDRLKTCVRSYGRTPQLLPRVSTGSANAAPSDSLTATVPSALAK